MTFIFRNRTIFWDIPKRNRGQTKWDGGSIILVIPAEFYLLVQMLNRKTKQNKMRLCKGGGQCRLEDVLPSMKSSQVFPNSPNIN